jgi:hypothetical protein
MTGKKNARDLAASIHQLKSLTGGLKDALPSATEQLSLAEEVLLETQRGFAQMSYLLARQRAVFLRFVHDLGVVPFGDTVEILASEAQYAAEYDAMRFLAWLAMLGQEEDP